MDNTVEITNFINNIKKLRKHYMFTQAQMSILLRVDIQSLIQLESGKLTDDITVETLYEICKHFKLKPSQLFAPLDISECGISQI